MCIQHHDIRDKPACRTGLYHCEYINLKHPNCVDVLENVKTWQKLGIRRRPDFNVIAERDTPARNFVLLIVKKLCVQLYVFADEIQDLTDHTI